MALPSIRFSPSFAVAALGCFVLPVHATTYTVRSDAEWTTAVKAAKPGDTLRLQGTGDAFPYPLQLKDKGNLKGDAGSSDSPIQIVASVPLGTTLHGLLIRNSANVVVRGFKFASDTVQPKDKNHPDPTKNEMGALLKIQNSNRVKVLANQFTHDRAQDSQKSILMSDGSSGAVPTNLYLYGNQIGYNEFSGFQSNAVKLGGNFIQAANATGTQIHHNYFHDLRPFAPDGKVTGDAEREAIALGAYAYQNVDAQTRVEYNLFEDCDGEDEIITVKTSNNHIRYNTFKNSYGSVTLRQGNGSRVYGNHFIGSGAGKAVADPNYKTGGIRVYGDNHLIYNNHFQKLTGTGLLKPIVLDAGDTKDSSTDGHRPATGVKVLFNTFIDNAEGIGVEPVDSDYTLPATGNRIDNNLVVGEKGSLLLDKGVDTRASHNIADSPLGGASLGSTDRRAPGQAWQETEVWNVDASLVSVKRNGYSLKTPGSGSLARNWATAYPSIDTDIEGQTRGVGQQDVGADEVDATDPVTRQPLTAANVGPAAMP